MRRREEKKRESEKRGQIFGKFLFFSFSCALDLDMLISEENNLIRRWTEIFWINENFFLSRRENVDQHHGEKRKKRKEKEKKKKKRLERENNEEEEEGTITPF